ncbi:MAG: GNAT family N-acetyltransferase [Bryobacteraceae bacterium]
MSISLCAMRYSDIAAGLHLCRACQWNQVEDDWRCFLDFDGAACRLALRDDAVLGTVAFLRFGRSFSWIAMMLVDPQARRAGIASRLMEWALESLREESSIRLDATPAGEPLYRRYGFREEYPLVRMKVAAAAEEPSAALAAFAAFVPSLPSSRLVRRMEPADLPQVFARDRAVFGADRSALLASFYRRAPELAWVARESKDGYCFGRPGYLYSQLGPIVAEDAETAASLVSHCLSAQHLPMQHPPTQHPPGPPAKPFAIDVPKHSPDWICWMESAGFAIERPFLRMCRGDHTGIGLPDRQFAIGGPEFG